MIFSSNHVYCLWVMLKPKGECGLTQVLEAGSGLILLRKALA